MIIQKLLFTPKKINIIYAFCVFLMISSCTTSKIQTKKSGSKKYSTTKNTSKSNSTVSNNKTNKSGDFYKKNAIASYYHDKFNGRSTANGEKFNNSKFTAAHKTLPFGTLVRVTNLVNNKSVDVKINDRGPFTKGREIDLSKKAFFEISDKTTHGTLDVSIEILK